MPSVPSEASKAWHVSPASVQSAFSQQNGRQIESEPTGTQDIPAAHHGPSETSQDSLSCWVLGAGKHIRFMVPWPLLPKSQVAPDDTTQGSALTGLHSASPFQQPAGGPLVLPLEPPMPPVEPPLPPVEPPLPPLEPLPPVDPSALPPEPPIPAAPPVAPELSSDSSSEEQAVTANATIARPEVQSKIFPFFFFMKPLICLRSQCAKSPGMLGSVAHSSRGGTEHVQPD